jgi:aconitate hydratase
LESALRNQDGILVTAEDVQAIAAYDATSVGDVEIPFIPGRVVLQDFTGVPSVVDLAAMRDAIVRMTGDESDADKVNPGVASDLVVDHSVQVDAFNRSDALVINSRREFERNEERYEFLKWGQSAFRNFRVVPPATGIVHQVNLEFLAKVTWDDGTWLYPDSLVGTDSHTTMINGLGVLGWGVGGIDAEAAMLGQPISMLLPEVVGFELTGRLADGATATDLVLRVTEMLRQHGVVGKFVEFHGPGLADMPLANRATIANMAPEYGATVGFFPVDEQTLRYMRLTGRTEQLVEAVEMYCKEQGLWRDDNRRVTYSSTLSLDMSTVSTALAGPKRPQDRIDLTAMQSQWRRDRELTFGKTDAGGSDVPVRRRRRRHRRHHLVHQHLQPRRHGGSGPGCPEGPGARPEPQALGEDLTGPRFEGGHRVPRGLGPARRSRGDGVLHRGVRVHDLHRQLGAAPGADLRGDPRQRHRRRLRAVGQPQLRGQDLP